MAIDPPTAEVEGKSKRRVGCTTTTTCFKEIRFLALLAVYNNNTYIGVYIMSTHAHYYIICTFLTIFKSFSRTLFSQDDTAEQILKKIKTYYYVLCTCCRYKLKITM